MPFFGDLGDAAQTFLGNKTWFGEDAKVKVVAKTSGGVKYTFENNAKKSSAALSFKAGDVNVKKLKMDSKGTITLEGESTKLADGVDGYCKIVVLEGGKNTAKGEENGQLGVKYSDSNVNADVNVDFLCKNAVTINANAVASYEGFFAGLDARINTGAGGVDGPWKDVPDQSIKVAAGYIQNDFEFASTYDKNADELSNDYTQQLADSTAVHGNVTVSGVTGDKKGYSLECGSSYKVDGSTTLKGKISSGSVLSVGYTQKMNKTATLNIISSFNAYSLDDHKVKFSLDLNL